MNNKILDEIDKRDIIEGFWDFKEANTKTYTHGFHSYPAMMIPQLVEEFLNIVGIDKNIKNIFDPFMGSGTTLVEGLVHGLDVIGNDLNPLSRLISSVKTNPIEIAEMRVNSAGNDLRDLYQEPGTTFTVTQKNEIPIINSDDTLKFYINESSAHVPAGKRNRLEWFEEKFEESLI